MLIPTKLYLTKITLSIYHSTTRRGDKSTVFVVVQWHILKSSRSCYKPRFPDCQLVSFLKFRGDNYLFLSGAHCLCFSNSLSLTPKLVVALAPRARIQVYLCKKVKWMQLNDPEDMFSHLFTYFSNLKYLFVCFYLIDFYT